MELPNNPYQPPTTGVLPTAPSQPGSGQDATRGSRLAATMLDSLLLLSVMVPMQWAAGVYDNFAAYQKDHLSQVLWGLVGVAIMLSINGYLLATRAQTVGKVALGIKIITTDGKNADFWRIVTRRLLPINVLSFIPVVGAFVPMADCIAIFGKQKRCLHDRLADTRVVRV